MKTVFADTGYWIAILNPTDSLHERARQVTQQLGAVKIITSEMVLTELLNAFSSKGNRLRSLAANFVTQAITRSDIEVIAKSSELFQQSLFLYTQRPDQDWSQTDCASFVLMQQNGITEALAYDKHFEQAGFIALLR